MKTNGFLVLGIALLLIGAFSSFQIVDTSKPEYELSLMVPKKNGNYTKLDYVRFVCRDLESGIQKIEFSVWQTGKPATRVLLKYNHTIGPVPEEPPPEEPEPPPPPPSEEITITFRCYYYVDPLSGVKVYFGPEGGTKEMQISDSVGEVRFYNITAGTYEYSGHWLGITKSGTKSVTKDATWSIQFWTSGMPLQTVDETWEVWEITLDPAITEEGDYRFHFYFYDEAGLYAEIPAPSTFTIVSSIEDSTAEDSSEEQADYTAPDEDGDYGPLPGGETPHKPSPYTDWEIPFIFVFVGGISVVYGMMQEKRKGI